MIRHFRPVGRFLLLRILLVEAVTFLAACVVLPWLALSQLHASAARIQEDLLIGQAQTLARGLSHDPAKGWSFQPDETLRPIFDTGYDGRAYAIVDAAHRVVQASRYALPGPWPAWIYTDRLRRFDAGLLTGVSLPVTARGQRAWLVVTQDQARPGAVVDDVMRAFLTRYVVALVALLVLMQAINGLLLWQSFRGLRRITREAAGIGPRALDTELDERGLPAEVRPLVQALNGLLFRVRGALHQQDEFAGNVAHELRTPLATLRLRVGLVADPGLREALIAQIDRIDHVLSQLRSLALLEGAAEAAMAPVDLAALAVSTIAEMTPRILTSGRTIAVEGENNQMLVMGNAGLLGIALGNLIENAMLHTRPDAHIEVHLAPPGSIAVADDGPGIAEDQVPRLLRRFHRADQARSDGAGLGLSIVQRIVGAHHARLAVDRAPQGGARFRINFVPVGKP